MKFNKLAAVLAAGTMITVMAANVMAAGSVTDAVDMNNVTANTVAPTAAPTQAAAPEKIGNIQTVATESVGVTLSAVTEAMYEEKVQEQVNALNDAPAESSVKDAFLTVFTEEELPVTSLYGKDGLVEEEMDLEEMKFLSPVMDLALEKEPSEEEPVEVAFTANNLTENIEVFVLHLCEEHNWELLETEKISDNQVAANFHSASPIALIYREIPEEEAETDTEKTAP